MSETSTDSLSLFLQKQFGAGPRFTAAYLRYFEWSQNLKLRSAADWEALDPVRRMWFDYALSTNARGDELMDLIESRLPLRGRRYLDIGCGFGGFLVAAGRRGALSTGIELDPLRLDFSRDNIADARLDIPLVELDALDPDLPSRLGLFDVITLSDVVEHVMSPAPLFANVARMLNPGGLVYVKIPNRDSLHFVASDGHFGLFGITQLDRATAIQYHWEHFHWDYDVGDYYSLETCLSFFSSAGLRAELVPPPSVVTAELTQFPALLEALQQAHARLAEPNPSIRARLEQAYSAYRSRLDADRLRLSPADFRNRYLADFWAFLGTPSPIP